MENSKILTKISKKKIFQKNYQKIIILNCIFFGFNQLNRFFKKSLTANRFSDITANQFNRTRTKIISNQNK